MMRRGIGSLQVRIGGLGNLASTDTRTGSAAERGTRGVDDCLRKSPPFFTADGGGCLINSCWRLA
jgi:hypothetical protein